MRKSHFEPEVALGIAEAIEVSISLAQHVTVPVLDARLQELRHEFKADVQMLKGEIQSVRSVSQGSWRNCTPVFILRLRSSE